MRQKMELIKQIRAAESFPSLKANIVDLAETPGYGFLSEMSIAEVGANESSFHSEGFCERGRDSGSS